MPQKYPIVCLPGLRILMSATSPQIEKISATDSMVGLSMGRFSTKTVLERAKRTKIVFLIFSKIYLSTYCEKLISFKTEQIF